jgi:hypothetical protein
MREIDYALLDAAYKGDVDGVRRALQAGARINARIWPSNHTALGVAATAGHTAVVLEVLAAGAKIDIRDDLGRTPLHLAAGENKVEILRELLKAGADIEAVSDAGETPLIEAARWGHLEAVRALIAAGADVNRVIDGETAYDHAMLRKHQQVAEVLRSRGGSTAISGAKALAQEVARAFGARARRGGSGGAPGWPATHFELKAIHRGRPIEIQVFDGGCTVEARGGGDDGPVFALNRPFSSIEKRVAKVPGLTVALFRHPDSPADELRRFFRDANTRRLVSSLRLIGDELLAVAGQSVYLLHRSTDVGALRDRLDRIAELVPPPKPVRLVTETAHRVKIGRQIRDRSGEGARHSFGGELDPPVRCRNCKASAHLLLSIDTMDRALGLKALGRGPLRIVFCLDCMSFPSLTYVDHSRANPRIVRQDPGERHNETPALEARRVDLSPLSSAGAAGSKVGGSPNWIQGPEIPSCIRCNEPMAFLAQLASTPTLAYGPDEGTLYTFVCTACKVTASLVQSH